MYFGTLQGSTLTLFVDGYERMAGVLPESPTADFVRQLTASLKVDAAQVSLVIHPSQCSTV
jgi:hypothetical protein